MVQNHATEFLFYKPLIIIQLLLFYKYNKISMKGHEFARMFHQCFLEVFQPNRMPINCTTDSKRENINTSPGYGSAFT